MGDKQAHIKNALTLISGRVGEVLALSSLHETPAWGYDSTETYQNMVLAVSTALPPFELLAVTQEIERTIGRHEKTIDGQYRDRVIDIDILLYDDLILQTPTLTIPHPLMRQRLFVLKPLSEIAPHHASIMLF